MEGPLKVFYVYADQDEALRKKLDKHPDGSSPG
jgi:hypothetical protein